MGPRIPIGSRILRDDRPSVGIGVNRLRGPHVLPLIARAGADYAMIDMEHTSFGLDEIDAMMQSVREHDLPVLVRPPEITRGAVGRLFDMGVDGILTPVIEGAEAAADAVRFAKYRPLGNRGDDGRLSSAGAGEAAALAERINAGVVVIVGVETPRAVDEIEEICAIPGLDGVWIGNSDLTLALGCPGDFAGEPYRAAERRVIDACRRHGVRYAVGAPTSSEEIRQQVELGCFTVMGDWEADLLRLAVAGYVGLVEAESQRARAGASR